MTYIKIIFVILAGLRLDMDNCELIVCNFSLIYGNYTSVDFSLIQICFRKSVYNVIERRHCCTSVITQETSIIIVFERIESVFYVITLHKCKRKKRSQFLQVF